MTPSPLTETLALWREDAACRLTTAAGLLASLVATGQLREVATARGRAAELALRELAAQLRSGAGFSDGDKDEDHYRQLQARLRADSQLQWDPADWLLDLGRRFRTPWHALRIFVRWHEVTTDAALEDLTQILGELDDVAAEIETLRSALDVSGQAAGGGAS